MRKIALFGIEGSETTSKYPSAKPTVLQKMLERLWYRPHLKMCEDAGACRAALSPLSVQTTSISSGFPKEKGAAWHKETHLRLPNCGLFLSMDRLGLSLIHIYFADVGKSSPMPNGGYREIGNYQEARMKVMDKQLILSLIHILRLSGNVWIGVPLR